MHMSKTHPSRDVLCLPAHGTAADSLRYTMGSKRPCLYANLPPNKCLSRECIHGELHVRHTPRRGDRVMTQWARYLRAAISPTGSSRVAMGVVSAYTHTRTPLPM